MALFTGTYENKVDGKGRVSLPAAFRDTLAQLAAGQPTLDRSFYIFPSPKSGALEACDHEFMELVADSIEEQADMFSDEEEALSKIIADAFLVQFDSTGRFVLPPGLQEKGAITDKALFVGKARRFQIWDPEIHRSYNSDVEERAKGVTLKLRRRPRVSGGIGE